MNAGPAGLFVDGNGVVGRGVPDGVNAVETKEQDTPAQQALCAQIEVIV